MRRRVLESSKVIKYETLSITLDCTNSAYDISSVEVTVSYDGKTETKSNSSVGIEFKIPAGKSYTVSYGYKNKCSEPSDDNFTAIADNIRTISRTYTYIPDTYNVTIRVSSSDPSQVSKLYGISINAQYDGIAHAHPYKGSDISFSVKENTLVTVYFPPVNGFTSPSNYGSQYLITSNTIIPAEYAYIPPRLVTINVDVTSSDPSKLSELLEGGLRLSVYNNGSTNYYTYTGQTISFSIQENTTFYITYPEVINFESPGEISYNSGTGSTKTISEVYTYIKPKPVRPGNGVYVIDNEGYYYTKGEWDTSNNSKAAGVACVTPIGESGNGFVIAKLNLTDKSSLGKYLYYFIGDLMMDLTKRCGINETGRHSTNLMVKLEHYETYAAHGCNNYLFNFNGKAQGGYLMGLDDFNYVLSHKSTINDLLSYIGGKILTGYLFWLSWVNPNDHKKAAATDFEVVSGDTYYYRPVDEFNNIRPVTELPGEYMHM